MRYFQSMKNTVIVLAIAFTALCSFSGDLCAQKTKANPESTPSPAQPQFGTAHFKSVFDRALRYNDLGVASEAVYQMLSISPANEIYLDTLAVLYFQRSAWPQTILVCNDLLAKEPNKPSALELRAIAHQNVGMIKESLADFEILYPITKNSYHLYEIAAMQYTMRRYGECDATLGKLLKDPEIKDKKIDINASQNERQSVPLAAACHNMAGVMLLEQGRKPEAAGAFKAALELFPDFVLAKNNLKEAEKP
jgi:tetratricopeptide (TPR) repeat protein